MSNFTTQDINQINIRGISIEKILDQIQILRNGLPVVELVRPCRFSDGIISIPFDQYELLYKKFKNAADAGRLMKFIPASGAASRMFKHLLEILNSTNDMSLDDLATAAENGDESATLGLEFFRNLESFAFFDELIQKLIQNGLTLPEEDSSVSVKPVLKMLLAEKGLNYANLPKGMIPFHRYETHTRTPFEEHLIAAREITKDRSGTVQIHFTISENNLESISNHINDFVRLNTDTTDKFNVTFSAQKQSTDTIVIDSFSNLLRDADGQIVFRPGGHGALIENLNDLNSDIVMIKNIDNIIPEALQEEILLFEKMLCGYFLIIEEKLFEFLPQLETKKSDESLVRDAGTFAENDLLLKPPDGWSKMSTAEKSAYLFNRLNRPLRVCGMVKNTGAPGGGPFWVVDRIDRESKQIVEASQINTESATQKSIWLSSTHFNPVDMVCGLRNFRGEKFNLLEYVDKNSGFISNKNFQGREIKALELPGLWNGAMASWLTVFVDVPLFTFNPVKTVNDLLKKNHLTSIE